MLILKRKTACWVEPNKPFFDVNISKMHVQKRCYLNPEELKFATNYYLYEMIS